MNFGQQQQFDRVRRNIPGVTVDLAGHQIDGHVQDRSGKNILSVAIESDNQEVFDTIMSLPSDARKGFFYVCDDGGRYPSELAIGAPSTHYLERLLESEPTLVNQQNNKTGSSLMHRVLRREALGIDNDLDKKMARIVRSYQPNPFLRNKRGESPLEAVNRLHNIRLEQMGLDI